MITTTFCSCVPPGLHVLLDEAVQMLAQRLGIESYNAQVKLHFQKVKFLKRDLVKELDLVEGGGMGPTPVEENAERVDKGLVPDKFDISLSVGKPQIMMQTLAHEMVHLKQWVTKELTTKTLRKGTPEDHYLYYYGTPVDLKETKYEDLPWEKEPRDEMEALGEWLMLAIHQKGPEIERKTAEFLKKRDEAKTT